MHRRAPSLLAIALACLFAALLAGCGDDEDAGRVAGSTLTIYSSVPLEGPDGAVARDVERAERLALREAHGRAGRYTVRLVAFDAATPKAGRWDPAQISQNARRAAKDPAAIAYLGELNPGSSAISIPLTNEADMLQVSPLDTAMELTTRTLAIPGSPFKYYPKFQENGRTFGRVVPSDRAQAAALLAYLRQEGARRVVLLTDEDPNAAALAMVIRARARDYGVAVVRRDMVDPHEQDPRDLVEQVADANPDAVVYTGGMHDGSVRLWQDLTVADPGLKLFATGALVGEPFLAAVGAAADSTYVTRPALSLDSYPAPAEHFTRAFEEAYGHRPAPEALYGYEAANAVLAAIRRAVEKAGERPLKRSDVVRAFRDTRRDDTVLGSYEIDRAGDTSLDRWGAYRVQDGRLRWVGGLAPDQG